jgi:hypothetical protein
VSLEDEADLAPNPHQVVRVQVPQVVAEKVDLALLRGP